MNDRAIIFGLGQRSVGAVDLAPAWARDLPKGRFSGWPDGTFPASPGRPLHQIADTALRDPHYAASTAFGAGRGANPCRCESDE